AEVQRHTIELLRQPLEERQIVIARVSGTCIFPASFMLVGAMNPCPCGYYPDMNRCTCSRQEINSYLNRLSQPLLDRMDLSVEVLPMSYQELTERRTEELTSASLREIVTQVQELQRQRYRGNNNKKLHYNSELSAPDLERYCPITASGKALLKHIFEQYHLSARAYHRIIKVSRTIADISGSEEIDEPHIQEASCFRSFDKNAWKPQ
ncbi:MAG: ATP-binding protein, partial [Lachnospiraceae bacterium]|nr:ATP-binding protein [Lachnospiraceae bacterium]